MARPVKPLGLVLLALSTVPRDAQADEGMWPFNRVPIEAIQARHHVTLDAAWLEKAMRAGVRLNDHASGSFVSPSGLLLTNHHVAAECIQQLSGQEGSADLMKDGFVAQAREQERRCPGLEVDALRSIEDVTEEVEAARVHGRATEPARNAARKAVMARIEKACARKTGLRCDVVTLYSGGAYHLYRYQKYTDIRLVFAPELEVAFFGGDHDNFDYPRFCLDVALLRAYQNDAPAKIDDYFHLSKTGAAEGDSVFIAGNPRATDRFVPVSELELLKDVAYPFLLQRLRFERDALRAYSEKSAAHAKAARRELMRTENALKAYTGYFGGLSDRALLDEARKREVHLISAVRALKNKKKRDRLLEAWPALETANKKMGAIYRAYSMLEKWPPEAYLAQTARHLLRHAQEMEKKNEVRLSEYRDSNLESVEASLFASPPIDRDLETELMVIGLGDITAGLGANDPLIKKILGSDSVEARARQAVEGTKLGDVEVRKKLWRGGAKAIRDARDPMLELVSTYDARALALRRQFEDEVESVQRKYSGRIAEAYTDAFGRSIYPNATFTPRFNDGRVAGYSAGGHPVAWRTTFAGMFAKYDEAKGKEPYTLPERWLHKKASLELDTPLDFLTTNDIIGGNSGSPILSADGKVVGVIFDGNLPQLPNRFLYREEQARAIGVHGRALLHALDAVYEAGALVQELTR